MPDLVLKNLRKRYGEVDAVRDLSLKIRDGELVTLLGPSGCGKTTTLRLIAGFITPDEGTISIGEKVVSAGGQGVSLAPNQRNIGLVFQSYALWPHMTIYNNVAYGLKAHKVAKDKIRPKVMAALQLVHMDAYADRYPAELSGGQQQRVALARAIVYDPSMLLLDEPLSNLDAKLREQMRVETRDLQQRLGFTSVYVTHDQAEAMALSDRIAIMHRGVLHQIGTPEDVYRNPATSFVAGFIGTSNLLPARVQHALEKGDIVDVALPSGTIRARAAADLTTDTAVSICTRAESITLASADTERNGDLQWYPGRVQSMSFFGDSRQYLVEALGATMKVKTLPDIAFQPGDEVQLGVAAVDCIATVDTGEARAAHMRMKEE